MGPTTQQRDPDWFTTFAEDLWLKPHDSGEAEAEALLGLLQLQPGARVLDAPCGAGRIAHHLAIRGCRVTGVDLRPSFVSRCRARFAAESVVGHFIVADVRGLAFESEFEAVINWGGSFGYFSDEENARVLSRFAAAATPGGLVVIDQPHREWLLRHFRTESSRGPVTVRTEWDGQAQRVRSSWIHAERPTEVNRTSIRLYSPKQLRVVMEKCGLQVRGLYANAEGQPLRRGSRRMIAVGRRPDA